MSASRPPALTLGGARPVASGCYVAPAPLRSLSAAEAGIPVVIWRPGDTLAFDAATRHLLPARARLVAWIVSHRLLPRIGPWSWNVGLTPSVSCWIVRVCFG